LEQYDPFGAFRLDGRAALVTGGNSGLGRDALDALRIAGARVHSVSRTGGSHQDDRRPPLSPSEGDIVDLTMANAAEIALDKAEAAVGPINILVNSAGISMRGRAEETTEAEMAAMLALNLTACHCLSAAFVNRCKARGVGGSIIHIGSILADSQMRGSMAYAASKAGLEQMAKVQALEWGRLGIRVNVIAPGWFPTPMTREILSGPAGAVLRQKNPLGRLGTAGDIAGAVLLLASEAGQYITGALLHVDGGQRLAG
jgi:NAD(P)-dependent dehydrogenase (short-subunit alcohol dehydrogenase family)